MEDRPWPRSSLKTAESTPVKIAKQVSTMWHPPSLKTKPWGLLKFSLQSCFSIPVKTSSFRVKTLHSASKCRWLWKYSACLRRGSRIGGIKKYILFRHPALQDKLMQENISGWRCHHFVWPRLRNSKHFWHAKSFSSNINSLHFKVIQNLFRRSFLTRVQGITKFTVQIAVIIFSAL